MPNANSKRAVSRQKKKLKQTQNQSEGHRAWQKTSEMVGENGLEYALTKCQKC